MGEANTYHNKLRSGIILATGSTNGQGEFEEVSGGTLSGLARRDSDGAKVLVTNPHAVSNVTPHAHPHSLWARQPPPTSCR